MTRTDNAIRNAKYVLFAQALSLVFSFITRRFYVEFLSAEYLGLNGLFSNILTVLSLAELGIGTSVTFSLYKPIAERDEVKTAALMRFFGRAYTVIGTVVLAVGLLLVPFLRFFVDDIEAVLDAVPRFYLIYALYVIRSACSYFFTYKRTLLVADQKRYVSSLVAICSSIALFVAECTSIYFTRDYVLFMVLSIVIVLADNIAVSIVADRMYPFLRKNKNTALDPDDKAVIKTNIEASFLHNIGGVIVNGTDNIIISRFVGFLKEGIYSNYHLICAAVDSLIRPVFQSITPSFGDLGVSGDDKHKTAVFHNIFFAASWIYGFCSIAIFILAEPFITLWLGDGFELESSAVLILACNFYVTGMRRPGMLAREAMGLLRYDKWKSIIEAAINLVVSIALARPLGVTGVLIGTLASSLLTCFWIEPLVLYRYGLRENVGKYFVRYGTYTAVSAVAFAISYFVCSAVTIAGIFGFSIKTVVCCVVPSAIYTLVYFRTNEMKSYISLIKLKMFAKKEAK